MTVYFFCLPNSSFLNTGDKEGKPSGKEGKDRQVRTRSHSDNGEHRRLRKARGSNVVFDGSNIDFPSSPVGSPVASPDKQVTCDPRYCVVCACHNSGDILGTLVSVGCILIK